ncbi:hypothetical protein AXZ77_2380 [Thioclava sp. ES.031]|uniref:hypothetical protein n=1 Tax=Thioclava sp. ES.031 TaxID=1798203 RepID=UPI000BF4893A|nr:hypothetical protein [Thioclava sp. ES.031]PFG63767.1 hypothetical protein AXZ77_2380 [Thioclava sp. ES.031]
MARKVQPAWGWVSDIYVGEEHEIAEQRDLDIFEIYKILGLSDGAHVSKDDDPIFAISRALEVYENQAHTDGDPTTFAERHAVLKELHKHAHALSETFNEMGEGNFIDVEHGIALGLGQEPSYETFDEKPAPKEIAFYREFSTDHVHKIAQILELAVRAFPQHPDAPKRGRPVNGPLVELIQDLAWIYERHTLTDAYEGFTYDAPSKEYDGAFFRFAAAVIWKFDPAAAKTNNALGSQIRRALSEEMLTRNSLEVRYHFADEPEDGELASNADVPDSDK